MEGDISDYQPEDAGGFIRLNGCASRRDQENKDTIALSCPA